MIGSPKQKNESIRRAANDAPVDDSPQLSQGAKIPDSGHLKSWNTGQIVRMSRRESLHQTPMYGSKCLSTIGQSEK
jgi:hypothetical protein